ncbi:MAG: hypothetical protein IPH08_11180 [Rhodocyclaceae bacterium]|nr:hypothetical protein [Rhodocyclaceae bacterium]
MNIEELPFGTCFEYSGDEFIKTGPTYGTGQLGPRQILRNAYLKRIDYVLGTSEQKLTKTVLRSELANTFDSFFTDCQTLVPEDKRIELELLRWRFFRALTKSKSTPCATLTDRLDSMNQFLAEGNGRGSLNSTATVFNGTVGYFFIGSITLSGVKQECIFFSDCDNDIIVSSFLKIEDAVMSGKLTALLGAAQAESWPVLADHEKLDFAAQVKNVNDFLAGDNGQAQQPLASRVTVYGGRAGYFFKGSTDVEGKMQDCIIFSDLHEQKIITSFPPIPKYWEPSQQKKHKN